MKGTMHIRKNHGNEVFTDIGSLFKLIIHSLFVLFGNDKVLKFVIPILMSIDQDLTEKENQRKIETFETKFDEQNERISELEQQN
jgi:tetrahydromethanopterin S-methyltransferase subunit H